MLRMKIVLLKGRITSAPHLWEAWVEEDSKVIREETIVAKGETPEEAVGKLIHEYQRAPV